MAASYNKPSQWCSHDGVDGATCAACVLTKGYLGCCGAPSKSRKTEGTDWCDYLCKNCGDCKDEKKEAAVRAAMKPEQRRLREENSSFRGTHDAPASSKAAPPPDQMAAPTNWAGTHLVFLQDQIEELQKTVKDQSQSISQLQKDKEKQDGKLSNLTGFLTHRFGQEFLDGPCDSDSDSHWQFGHWPWDSDCPQWQ
jgi:hypothetical protein